MEQRSQLAQWRRVLFGDGGEWRRTYSVSSPIHQRICSPTRLAENAPLGMYRYAHRLWRNVRYLEDASRADVRQIAHGCSLLLRLRRAPGNTNQWRCRVGRVFEVNWERVVGLAALDPPYKTFS